jgi:putative tricarboxylic transport membrane protein
MAAVALGDAIGAKLNILPQAGAGGFAITQVSGGHADLAVLGLPESRSQIDAGNVRLLAILGPSRAPGKYGDAPTLSEAGFRGGEVSTVRSVFAPKGMPKPIFEKLVNVFGDVARSPEYRKFLSEQNSIPLWASGGDAVKIYDEQSNVFRPFLEKAGLLKEK